MYKDTNQKTNEQEYILELINISKSFPGVKALDNVSMKIKNGEVHALMGENGAGKSTAIKIICGVHKPDSGIIRISGNDVVLHNPHDAFSYGISVVHQERNLIPTFTIAENILLERFSERNLRTVNKSRIIEEAKKYMDIVGLHLNPGTIVGELSAGQKQMIEIARALSTKAKFILLDEPTASISIKEADLLLKVIRDLQKRGVSFLYISHKFEEVFDIANSITVLRDGKKIEATLPEKKSTVI